MESKAILPALFVACILVIAGLGIASGIGMWKGKKWGWYLGSFYYMYSIVTNANAFITIPMLINSFPPGELANTSRGPSYYYTKYAVRLTIHFLLYLYLFKGNVREFFSLSEHKKWKPILAELGVCIGIAAVVSMLASVGN